jgi:hypothetical protein
MQRVEALSVQSSVLVLRLHRKISQLIQLQQQQEAGMQGGEDFC